MASIAPFGPERQPGVLNNSQFHNLNGGSFYNTTGDAHIYNSTNSSANQLAHLHRFVAASALHDSNERFPQPKCHPFTRERIIQNIHNWAEKDSEERILWLSGSAGTGKSAIAQTVAEHCNQNGRLAAAFFFFRSSPERNTSAPLVATLAYQITLSVPGAKEFVTKAIEDDPALFSKDINSQLVDLIVRPLILAARGWDSMYKFLIIIDGLDECTDEKQQSDVLSAISNALRTTRELPLRFLIASRPEYHIRTRFERIDLQAATVRFVLDVDDTATQDIATFLEKEFSRIREERHIRETPWPANGVIRSLAERASGQFIYASTIIKFLDDLRLQPQERLDVVLGTLPHGTFSPFAEIDLLYTQILDTASNIEATLLCLGTILFIHQRDNRNPFSHNLSYLDQLFRLNPGGVEHLLMNLHSLLNVQSKVSIRHKSFSDFLTDEARSGQYFIDKETMLAKISRLLWATIPRWLNQFEDLETVPKKLPERDDPLSSALHNWTMLLPDGRHAGEVLDELSAIADLVEKKPFDIRFAVEKLPYGVRWRNFYPVIIFWLSREKLDEQNPVLLNKYISFYDKDILRFLKQVEFLDPVHSIHSFFGERWINNADILSLGVHSHFEIFDRFFSDPRRSGKYYLTPQDRADIVVWMVQRFPRISESFVKLLYGESCGPTSEEKLLDFMESVAGRLGDLPIDIHLSRASPCADKLIDLIRSHNPDTFLLGLCKNNVGMERYSTMARKSIEKVNKAMARYLLDNSRLYEQSIKENPRTRSSFRRKWGTVSLLLVISYLLMLAFYFKFHWIFILSAPLKHFCSDWA